MNTFFRAFFFSLLVLASPLESCSQNTMVDSSSFGAMLKTLLAHTVPEISVTGAAAEKDALFLDAREAAEYEVSHIANALYVGYDSFTLDSLVKIPKDQPLIVYCSVGYRSEKVSEQLIADGYTNVKNLYGGIFEWKNQGLPVVDESNETTERVHAYSRTWGIWLKNGKKVY
jgi:rhodanese-related sulfurtransferase